MGVFAGTERQCTEDEHDDEDESDSQISEFSSRPSLNRAGHKLEAYARLVACGIAKHTGGIAALR